MRSSALWTPSQPTSTPPSLCYSTNHVIFIACFVFRMNVLHWHAIDAESFPINAPSEPTMIKGAFSPSMTYSMADISDVVSYGFDRGVEVILELDMPGHAASWTAVSSFHPLRRLAPVLPLDSTQGKKEIMADCFAKYYYNINDFALNPALDETYITIQNILTDVTKAANSYKIHLGGRQCPRCSICTS